MKLKRLLASAVAVTLLSSLTAIGSFAANNHDTGFSFTVGPNWQARTEFRDKTNSTSVYVNSLSGPSVTYFYVIDPNGGIQNSGKGVAPISPGTKRCIYNHVYENGWRTCALATLNNPYTGQSTGVWSPDTVGSYIHAN